MLESAIERSLVKKLKALDPRIKALKLNAVGQAGFQDRLLLLPRGIPVFVELKRPGARLRALQEHRRRELRELGFYVLDASTPEGVQFVVTAVGALLK